MTIREIDFLTGFETSTAPTTSDPIAAADTVSKGYADDTYTPRSHVYGKVTDINGLKAIASADRFNEQIAYVAGLNLFYEFDAASVAAGDDDLVVVPTSGTGRWLKVEFAGGGGGGSAAGLDVLIQKMETEGATGITSALDNSAYVSGFKKPFDQYLEANLMSDFTAGGTTMDVVWNAISVNDSDKNFDTTTGWGLAGSAVNLTTSATRKIGSASVSIDKDGSGVTAVLRYDRGAQNFNVGSNYRVWFWINMPSITNLDSITFIMYSSTLSDTRKWTKTTDYAGNAIAVGWNLMFIDLSDTTGTTTTGTGWTYTQLSRYQQISVVTTLAAQTYTGILVDSLYFSYGAISKFNAIGQEFTIFDSSVTNNIVIDSSNTRSDGRLTLSAAFGTTTTGGTTGAARGRIKRSTMTTDSPSGTAMTNGLSGNANIDQYLRLQTMHRETLSSTYQMFVDQGIEQLYEITTVGGSTVGIYDIGNSTANLVTSDLVDIFRPYYTAGEVNYSHVKEVSITAVSTFSTPTTTVTINTTDIQIGDLLVKRLVTSASISVVGATSNENFANQSIDATPNGAILLGEFKYPQEASVYCHYTLGDSSNSEATRNRKGIAGSLTVNGTLNVGETFFKGRYGVSGFNDPSTNYLSMSAADSQRMSFDATDNANGVQISFWFYDTSGFTGSSRFILSGENSGAVGYLVQLVAASNTITMTSDNGAYTSANVAYTVGQWNHVFLYLTEATNSKLYVNGALGVTTSSFLSATSTYDKFYIGRRSANTSGSQSVKIADLIAWRNASALTLAEINYLYNAGNYRNTLGKDSVRLKYTANGQSGQKASMKVRVQRTTSAVNPTIQGAGFIKSS